MRGKGMQEGRDGKKGEIAVRDNGVAAFISLWIGIGGRRNGEMEKGREPNVMGEWSTQRSVFTVGFIRQRKLCSSIPL